MTLFRVAECKITANETVKLNGPADDDFIEELAVRGVKRLICGGINKAEKTVAAMRGIEVIDNVSCSLEEAERAVLNETMRPGYGFDSSEEIKKETTKNPDCVRCSDRKCLRGEECELSATLDSKVPSAEDRIMLEASFDVSAEEERNLCRLSELIYFALEMEYKKIGVAYCTELREPTEILISVLNRFFETVPVCCKVGGKPSSGASRKIACNPLAQAEILNAAKTDFNVQVGLCVGADCIFSKRGEAPSTTLFVKDRSLANNPIGALYSEIYLKETLNDRKRF